MSCLELDEIEKYVSGVLDLESSRPIEAHVANCASCRALLDEVSQNLEAAARARAVIPPRALPEVIGAFRVVRELGRGGMGIVYLAEQEHPRRRVAIKVLQPGAATPGVLRRFEHEADLLGRLNHPGIAQIHEAGTAEVRDAGITEFRPFLVMEYIEGERLDEWVRRAGPDRHRRLRLFARLCDAVHHAHLNGVVHRDLKPGNVLVLDPATAPDAPDPPDAPDATDSAQRNRGEPRPKILDFGVARALDAGIEALSRQTDVGQLLGTLPFMSPEQVLGDSSQLDARSDVYSLGVLGYWLLAGDLPYALRGRSVPEVARIIRDEDPAKLGSVAAAFRGDLETVIGKALEKNREVRYQSAAELAADVRRFLADEPIMARPPRTSDQLRKFARRNRALVGAVGASALALAAAAAIGTSLAVRATRAERHAREQLERAETEGAKQRAVSEFLHGMLAAANPYGERGDREATVPEVLDRAAGEIDDGRFDDHPDVEVAVRATLGESYWALARYENAEHQFRTALELGDRGGSPQPEDRARLLDDLGLLLAERNRYAEAESLFRVQHDLSRESFGDADVRTLRSVTNLAGVATDQGRVAEAEALLTSVLDLSRRLTGDERDLLVSQLRTLAAIHHIRGDDEGAVPLMKEAIDVSRERWGPDHPTTSGQEEGLATILTNLRRFDEAEALLRDVLAQSRRAFGAEHPRVAQALGALGECLYRMRSFDEAEAVLREAVAMSRKVLGVDHRSTATSLGDLAHVMRTKGRLDDAEALYLEALAIQRRVHGADHPDAATTLNDLGGLEKARGRFDAAESYYAEALEIRVARLGTDHSLTAVTRADIVALQQARHRAE